MSAERARFGPRRLLLLTFLIFFLPIIAAWLLNVLAPGWLPFGTVNHGTLVQPVRPVSASGLVRLDGGVLDGPLDSDFLAGRWTLVHVVRAPCARECLDALTRTRQVRRALGDDMSRTQHLAVVADAAFAGNFDGLELTAALADGRWLAPFEDVSTEGAVDGASGARAAPALYLVDPQGYLMMRYPPEVEQDGLLADLKRLLKLSKIG